MNKVEILKRKIAYQKQWLWMLVNLSDEELQLPRNISRQDALNDALDEINYYNRILEKLKNEQN